MKTIQIDVDGVLIDSNIKGLRRLCPQLRGVVFLTYDFNKSLDFNLVEKNYHFNQKFPQGKNVTYNSLIKLFEDPNIINSQDLMPFAVESITKLSSYFKILIRTLSYNKEVERKKEIVLSDILRLPNVDFFSVIKENGNIVKEKIDCDYYLDDYVENFFDYFNSNTKCFLIDRTYNQFKYNPQYYTYQKDITRTYDLKHFYELMIKTLE